MFHFQQRDPEIIRDVKKQMYTQILGVENI